MAGKGTALSFQDVNFSYGGEMVLQGATFSVPPGEFLIT